MKLEQLHNMLREMSKISRWYSADFKPPSIDRYEELRGFAHSKLTLAVNKETVPKEFAFEQATFMLYLGEHVCPKIFAINTDSYVMEFLSPVMYFTNSLTRQEMFLEHFVWKRSLTDAPYAKQLGDESWIHELAFSINIQVPDWALDTPCLIHGDPTLDNTFNTPDGDIRIADPIPPHRLMRPSIRAVDHGKILQSLLGWEVVLRGMQYTEFAWPTFMMNYETARRAIFWCIVALKRIALRNTSMNAGKWAEEIAGRLEKCEL